MSIDLVFTLSKVINNKHMINVVIQLYLCKRSYAKCEMILHDIALRIYMCFADERWIVEYADVAYVRLLRRICSSRNICANH